MFGVFAWLIEDKGCGAPSQERRLISNPTYGNPRRKSTRARYAPVNFAGRFSRNARTPSVWSCVSEATCWMIAS